MSEPIVIKSGVFVPIDAIAMRAVRSSGPGGQNVNKVSSKVELRVDPAQIVGIDEAARARLRQIAPLDADGWILVTSQETRDQPMNLLRARDKVRALIEQAMFVPKKRKKTRPSRGAVERRISEKKLHGRKKASRRGDD
jgi:ribosome-associated protein